MKRLAVAVALIGMAGSGLAGCNRDVIPDLAPLPEPGNAGIAAPRLNGSAAAPISPPSPQVAYGTPANISLPQPPNLAPGDISLDFADTDLREIVRQILDTMLKVTYTIDPAVHGTATLHTARPIARSQLLPTLQALLAENGAALVFEGGVYRVLPNAAAVSAMIIKLKYASADELVRVLQPFVGVGGAITADPGRNALLVSGDPTTRETLQRLVSSFDIDVLSGQSYALLPVTSDDAKDFATSLQQALGTLGSQTLSNAVRVVPMARVNAVLVIAAQPSSIADARRIYGLIERQRRTTLRSWHVYYLQNSRSSDIARVLQQAFTPHDVSEQAAAPQSGGTASGPPVSLLNSSNPGSSGGSGSSGGGGGLGGGGLGGGGGAAQGGSLGRAPSPVQADQSSSVNPLLGGLSAGGGSGGDVDAMHILANAQNNAILIYATQQEEDVVESMLRKIDILPLQVRIDATIAEVTLNDQLQYGVQFFFKSGGLNGILNTTATAVAVGNPASAVLGTAFPGFLLGGNGQGGAPIALSALQAVTTVHVLSSPEILVLDNQPARLLVGSLVPFLTSSSQSTINSNAPIVNSVDYRQTGVITEVTPRVNSGGLVTLDIVQEVSDVAAATTTTGLNSPTFDQRSVSSRIVVEDGQTVGLAGLIQDSSSRGNQGIPWLKDIPLLGVLAGTQNNIRARTELLVLITPHVIHDQRDARSLTQDLREELRDAAGTPRLLRVLRPSGSSDPNATLRRDLGIGP